MRKTLLISMILFDVLLFTGCTDSKIMEVDDVYKVESNITIRDIETKHENHTITFVEDDFNDVKTYTDLDIKAVMTDESKDTFESKLIIDEEALDIEYTTLNLCNKLEYLNENRVKSNGTVLIKGDSTFEIVEGEVGNYLSIAKISEYIKENIGTDIIVNLKNFYSRDKLDSDIDELKKKISDYENTYISYTNGYKLTLQSLYKYLEVSNNDIVLNEDKKEEYIEYIDNLIEQELISYDTYGIERNFHTTNGIDILVSGGTWGNVFSSDNETLYIIELFSKFKNEENRVPIYKKELPNEIPSTYIEVSKDDQHLWYYIDGVLDSDTPVVTGTLGRHDTPNGVYYISECIDGKYLIGDTYKTWVDKWMRITNRGHGLHDASWRVNEEFGGSTYKYDGSHGCINLPPAFAYELFDKVEVNTCVVIY
ncbi:MAG: L,D-transpeptidase family protein [Lachnospiraceae bacterium]|nr:L,D-transpeptidase family protein [Lachnospiraceae bacterium]